MKKFVQMLLHLEHFGALAIPACQTLIKCFVCQEIFIVGHCRVHEYSVDALMYCALPYHDTREFQQLLGVLELEETTWFWLKRVQEAGIALPRSALVTRCLKDMVRLAMWIVFN